MNKEKIQHNFFFIVVAVMTLAALAVLQPYFSVLFLAIVFAIMFAPMQHAIEKTIRGKQGAAAFITMIAAALIVIVPVSLFGYLVFNEAVQMYGVLASNANATSDVARVMQQHMPGLNYVTGSDVGQYAGAVAQWIAGHLGALFSSVAVMLLNFMLILFALFFLLKDRDVLYRMLLSASPLQDKYNEELLDRIAKAIASVTKGILLIALIQGIESGIGIALVGVPHPVLWGGIAAVSALVPAVGTGLVIGPIALYLIATGKIVSGIMLAVWGLTIINITDALLRPILIGKGVNVHPILILFSALGGLQLFGPIGFLVGPVIIATLFALFEMYPSIMQEMRS